MARGVLEPWSFSGWALGKSFRPFGGWYWGVQFYFIGPVANSGLIGLLDARLLLFVVCYSRDVLSGEVLGRDARLGLCWACVGPGLCQAWVLVRLLGFGALLLGSGAHQAWVPGLQAWVPDLLGLGSRFAGAVKLEGAMELWS